MDVYERLDERIKAMYDKVRGASGKSSVEGKYSNNRQFRHSDIEQDISLLKNKCLEYQDHIAIRNKTIYDIISHNTELMKTISEYRKSANETLDSYDLIGKRYHLDIHNSVGVQTDSEKHNKSVQVYRYMDSLSDIIEERQKMSAEDDKKLNSIIKWITEDKNNQTLEEKS